MSGMSEARWRLADYLAEHGLSAYALGKATGITHELQWVNIPNKHVWDVLFCLA